MNMDKWDTEIDNFDSTNWEELENKMFEKTIRCFRLTINGKQYNFIGERHYHFIGVSETLTTIKKMVKKLKSNIAPIVCSPRLFLDKVENPMIPYGFWTCKCTKDCIRTPYSSHCTKCGCEIGDTTRKYKYIEEINF
jgi:hypothetical protein